MSFAAILDQDIAVRALRSALEKDRVPHAYIFVGPSGVGRRLTAGVLARALNCEDLRGTDPCDECVSCRLIAEGKHPDVQIIMPTKRSSTITVKQIEELLPFAHMRPIKGRHKVFILCEADRLGIGPANKILKTLEEPPAGTIFVLVTEKLEAVLPTIASRCQPIKFGRLRAETVERVLVSDFEIDPKNAATAAELAGGQVTRGLEFADPARTEAVVEIMESLGSFSARLETYDRLLVFFSERKNALQAEAEGEISAFGEELSASVKASIEDLRKSYVDRHYKDLLIDSLGLLLTLHRDVLVLKETGDVELVINRNRIELLRGLAETMSAACVAHNMRKIEEAAQYCSHFVGEDRVFMDLMLGLRHK
jgi:DNA polymerase-3 subunit delta'